MTKRSSLIIIVLIVGLLLLVAPYAIRTVVLNYDGRSYTPPDVPNISMAMTPAPTITPMSVGLVDAEPEAPLRAGPIIVDLAHFNRLNRSSFQPLASALAERNVGLRFWLPADIDIFEIQSLADFPDQSEALAEQLADASGLIVASPFFLWNDNEIALVEQFVADGGRLLLISDPDIIGDVASDINNLAEPFGVVFNDDYLYDTFNNDKNFTHIFIDDYLDRAEDLQGSTVAFYGARSIDGSGIPQVRTSDTTLSSLRTGLNGFTTVVIAGLETNNTAGRVLALSDFDVLTEPYVTRFDNRQVMEHAADFLANGERGTRLVDFPAFLGKEVALVYGSADSVDSALLEQSSQLQLRLEASGRELTLMGTHLLTDTGMLTVTSGITGTDPSPAVADEASISDPIESTAATPPQNLIYVSDFETAGEQTTLLDDLDVEIIEVIETPTPGPTDTATPTATPTATSTATSTTTPTSTASPTSTGTPTALSTIAPTVGATDTVTGTRRSATSATIPVTETVTATETATPTPTASETATVTPTVTPTATPTATPTDTPTPTATPTPKITVLLETKDGLRYLASETLVFVQQTGSKDERLLALLADDEAALSQGMNRLLQNAFEDCVIQPNLVICPYKPNDESASESSSPSETPTSEATPEEGATQDDEPPAGTPEAPPMRTPAPDSDGSNKTSVLVIDDDRMAADGETSEATTYLQILQGAGIAADSWSTTKKDIPTLTDVESYQWIIWSGAGYENSGLDILDLPVVMEFLDTGGRVTISSRRTFFGETEDPPTEIADIVTVNDIPELVAGLPTEPVTLAGSPAVEPLSSVYEGEEPDWVLRRGPASADADRPLAFVMTDENSDDSQGARLLVLGMSISWLPEDFADTFVVNMANWMLEE
jgi:hypothetical protein